MCVTHLSLMKSTFPHCLHQIHVKNNPESSTLFQHRWAQKLTANVLLTLQHHQMAADITVRCRITDLRPRSHNKWLTAKSRQVWTNKDSLLLLLMTIIKKERLYNHSSPQGPKCFSASGYIGRHCILATIRPAVVHPGRRKTCCVQSKYTVLVKIFLLSFRLWIGFHPTTGEINICQQNLKCTMLF